LSIDTSDDEFFCDFCLSNQLEFVYTPLGTQRGALIYLCNDCGLCQTKYTLTKGPDHPPSTSSHADWGNIRHGKGLRLDAIWPSLVDVILGLPVAAHVLDIGANRGDFLRNIKGIRPDLRLFGIEPDKSLTPQLEQLLPNVEIVNDRFENWSTDLQYDFIFCLHTLEHANTALGMLRGISDLLREDGMAYIEVPSLTFISDEQIVEEFFIDKHSFHFDEASLNFGVSLAGLSCESRFGDRYNLGVLVTPKKIAGEPRTPQPLNVRELIKNYESNFTLNTASLSSASNIIRTIASRQRLCIWGAGRIFDAICRSQDLGNVEFLLVDDYLSRHIDNVRGMKINDSGSIPTYDPDIVLLLTRSATSGIQRQLNVMGYQHIITFPELLQMASE
jgi:hypothetical protein